MGNPAVQRQISIDFGWEFTPASASQASFQHLLAGPQDLVALLATRLGMTSRQEGKIDRLLTYHRALEKHLEVHGSAWFKESFEVNSWATARYLLRLRDFLASFGWESSPQVPAAFSERLRALNSIEEELKASPGWLADSSNAAGAVARRLRDFTRPDAVRWPLGIGSVTLHSCSFEPHESLPQLPAVYCSIFESLRELGVEVRVAEPASKVQSFALYEAATEWEAAALAARILAGRKGQKTAVLVGSATDVLDRELLRRGVPQLGVQGSESRDIVGIFLAAVSTPNNPKALLDFLQVNFPGDLAGSKRPLVTPTVSRAFINALGREPGVGGEAWQEALASFKRPEGSESSEEKQRRERYRDTAFEIHDMVAKRPLAFDVRRDSELDRTLLLERLSWLRLRLMNLARVVSAPSTPAEDVQVELGTDSGQQVARRALPAELQAALGQVNTVLSVVKSLDRISSRFLRELVASSLERVALKDLGKAANPHLVSATAPARLQETGSDFLLWWAPLEDTVQVDFPLISSELQALSAQAQATDGFTFPAPKNLSRLTLVGQLSALQQFQEIVAIYPAVKAGKDAELAPLVSFLQEATQSGEPTPILNLLEPNQDTASNQGQLIAQDQAATLTWNIPGTTDQLHTQLNPAQVLKQPNTIEFTFTGGQHLLPTRLSHSQVEKLLTRPFEWLLEYPLNIREAAGANIPTGNRMVGTFMHKIAEELFKDAQAGSNQPVLVQVTEEEIGAKYDELLPIMAAEYSLPGAYRTRMLRREDVIASLHYFFQLLHSANVRISAMEDTLGKEEYGSFRVSTLTGAQDQAVLMSGFKDVEICLPDGRLGVIDLKYTNNSDRYKRAVTQGEATQLATYAASIQAGTGQNINDIPLGFFMLKQAHMHSISQDLFSATSPGKPIKLSAKAAQELRSTQELWEGMLTHLKLVFQGLIDGQLINTDDYRLLLQDAQDQDQDTLSIEEDQQVNLLTETYPQAHAYHQKLTEHGAYLSKKPNIYANYSAITGPKGDIQ